jgi:hypothetical protein
MTAKRLAKAVLNCIMVFEKTQALGAPLGWPLFAS